MTPHLPRGMGVSRWGSPTNLHPRPVGSPRGGAPVGVPPPHREDRADATCNRRMTGCEGRRAPPCTGTCGVKISGSASKCRRRMLDGEERVPSCSGSYGAESSGGPYHAPAPARWRGSGLLQHAPALARWRGAVGPTMNRLMRGGDDQSWFNMHQFMLGGQDQRAIPCTCSCGATNILHPSFKP